VLQGYREDANLFLESDADDQLIIHVIFNTATKLRSIVVSAADDGHAPKKIKLFTNNPTIGFSEAEDEKAVQEFVLTPEHIAGKPLTLKCVPDQVVLHWTLFPWRL
jgi:PITH domain